MKVEFIKAKDNIYVSVGSVIVGELPKRYDKNRYFQAIGVYPLSSEQLASIIKHMEELNES